MINLINSSIWRILVEVKYFYSSYYGGVSVGRSVSVGGGVSVGEGSGVSVGGSSVGDAVYVLTETAVFVGEGLGVKVAVGKFSSCSLSSVGVGKTNRVLDAVGEEVGVAVGVAVCVGVFVRVGINLANDSAVNAAAVFISEKARSTISPAPMTMGVGNVGSDNAIADAPQNRLKPRMLAAKIHRSPA